MAGGWLGGGSGWWGALGSGSSGSSGYLASDLITEARTLIDDDHDEPDGFLEPARWLTYINWELQKLARLCVAKSYIRPPITETEFTGPSTTIAGVMTFLGVNDSEGCPLKCAQSEGDPEPVWPLDNTGPSTYYEVHGIGDTLTVALNAEDTGTYTARHIPLPAYVTSVDQYVLVPQGFERRLVLGMASWAGIKDGTRSAAVAEKMREADDEIALAHASRVQAAGPRVKPRVRRPPYGRGY